MKEDSFKVINEVPQEDWLIQSLVSTANQSDIPVEYGVTLTSGGLIISGVIIGGKQYFKALAESMGPVVGEVYEKYAEKLYSEKEGEEMPPPGYIHLKNAKLYSTDGKSIPTNTGTLWRGRICCIDGFILGTLEAS